MGETIVMIHGMWGGPWCWENYKRFFEEKGYRCITPTLRYHDVDPKDPPPPELGTTGLLDYAEDLEKEIRALDEPPIIMGHSMGGYGAVKLSVKFPELFQVVASHSGPIAFENSIPDLIPLLLAETGILGYQPWNGTVSLFMYSASAAFSPDVDDWPYYVDLPVDYYGNVVDEVWDLWLGHDALTLAQENLANIQSIRFYMDCGDQDDYLFYNHSTSFSEFLDDENINHVYEIYPGDHFTGVLNGDRFPYSLAFIENAFYIHDLFSSLGDIDANGSVSMADFILLLQIVLQFVQSTEIQQTSGDLDFNGTIDIFDLLLLADQI